MDRPRTPQDWSISAVGSLCLRLVMHDYCLLAAAAALLFTVSVSGVAIPVIRRLLAAGLDGSSLSGSNIGLVPAMSGLSARLARTLCAAAMGLLALRALHLVIPGWTPPPMQADVIHQASCPDADDSQGLVERLAVATGRSVRSVGETDRASYLYLSPRPPAHWLAALFLFGCLLLVGGTIVGLGQGWASPDIKFLVGERHPLGEHSDASLHLDQLTIQPLGLSGPYRLTSRFTSTRPDGTQETHEVSYGESARFRGFGVYQTGHGPAVRIAAKDQASDKQLALGFPNGDQHTLNAQRISFARAEQEHLLSIPETKMLVRMTHYPTMPAQGLAQRALLVQVLDGTTNSLLVEELLTSSRQVVARGVVLEIGLEYFVNVQARHEPQLLLLVLGAMLSLVGLPGVAFWPSRAAWLALRHAPNSTFCQLLVCEREARSTWAAELHDRVSEVCNA